MSRRDIRRRAATCRQDDLRHRASRPNSGAPDESREREARSEYRTGAVDTFGAAHVGARQHSKIDNPAGHWPYHCVGEAKIADILASNVSVFVDRLRISTCCFVKHCHRWQCPDHPILPNDGPNEPSGIRCLTNDHSGVVALMCSREISAQCAEIREHSVLPADRSLPEPFWRVRIAPTDGKPVVVDVDQSRELPVVLADRHDVYAGAALSPSDASHLPSTARVIEARRLLRAGRVVGARQREKSGCE